ncbi:MAG: hypothetical protein ACBR50_13420 [Microcoleus sp.]
MGHWASGMGHRASGINCCTLSVVEGSTDNRQPFDSAQGTAVNRQLPTVNCQLTQICLVFC